MYLLKLKLYHNMLYYILSKMILSRLTPPPVSSKKAQIMLPRMSVWGTASLSSLDVLLSYSWTGAEAGAMPRFRAFRSRSMMNVCIQIRV